MNKDKALEERISNLLIKLRSHEIGLKKLEATVKPSKPVMPFAPSIETYHKIKEERNKIDNIIDKIQTEINDEKNNIYVLKSEIISLIPKSNQWFATQGGKIAFGYQTNDWPNSGPELKVYYNDKGEDLAKVLTPLKHQVIN